MVCREICSYVFLSFNNFVVIMNGFHYDSTITFIRCDDNIVI